MAVSNFHMHCEGCCAAPKPHTTNPESIYSFKNLLLQPIHRSIERLEQSFFCKPGCRIERTSYPHTYCKGRAWHSACIHYSLEHKISDTTGFRRIKHMQRTHIFRTCAFWSCGNFQCLSWYELPVDIRYTDSCIIFTVFSGQWIYGIGTQWNLKSCKNDCFPDCFLQFKAGMKLCSKLRKKDHNARILAHRNSVLSCKLYVFQDCLELGFCNMAFF